MLADIKNINILNLFLLTLVCLDLSKLRFEIYFPLTKTDRRGNENNYDGIPQPVQLCWPLINKYVMTMSCSTNLVDCWWCAGDDARGCVSWSQILLM